MRFLLGLVIVVGLLFIGFLAYIASQDLFTQNRSTGVQAYAAILTFLVTTGLFVLNTKSEQRAQAADTRAVRADQRSERAEQENDRLRESAERQAAAMQALAIASAEQASLLQRQHLESATVRLHLLDIGQNISVSGAGGVMRQPSFVLVNMSTYGVYIQEVTFLTIPGTELHRVEIGGEATIGYRSSMVGYEKYAVLLAPGASQHLKLPMVSRLNYYAGGPATFPGYRVSILCLYPGRGQTELRFRVEWARWEDTAPVSITPIDLSGNDLVAS